MTREEVMKMIKSIGQSIDTKLTDEEAIYLDCGRYETVEFYFENDILVKIDILS